MAQSLGKYDNHTVRLIIFRLRRLNVLLGLKKVFVSPEGFPFATDNTSIDRGANVHMEHGVNSGCERALWDAVLAGNGEAWRHLYSAHFDRLAAYARWRCGGLADLADDVIQEAWLTAVRKLKSFDPSKGPFFGWLRGLAANAARNALRSRRRRRQHSRPLGQGEDAAAAGQDLVAIEKAERVAAALAAIPEHYEAVLRAKYLEQMSVAQIAETHGESPKAVESLLTRARQAFRVAYETQHE